MSGRLRITVLVSGSGSNLQALIDACAAGRLDADIIHVISNVAAARGLQRARDAGIRSSVLEHGAFADRSEFDAALARLAAEDEPDLVVLAGFMRIIGTPMLDPFRGRMINLHPSLLPRYRGTDTYQRALDAGDPEHGASIHFVTEELDGGPVIAQVVIPILPGDDAVTLAARLGPMEHRLVVATVGLFAGHRVECIDATVRVDGGVLAQPLRLRDDGGFGL
jgi:phosphoribosylglycinamide formyltransferase-1